MEDSTAKRLAADDFRDLAGWLPPATASLRGKTDITMHIQGATMMTESSLAARVDAAITSSPYLTGRKLRFETVGGHVILEGIVSTYFQKQMAQEVVRRVQGVERIDNQLEVTWSAV
jgi:osmotically-inducible protein OsmY